MDIIRSKQVLNNILREAMYQDEENPIPLPKSVFFRDGLSWPTFKITIEMMNDDTYIDEKGAVWKKIKN